MQCGDAFLIPAPGFGPTPHLWIVTTEPGESPAGDCIIVNVTTLRRDADQTVTLMQGDHPFVRHPSVVNYADARIVKASSIEQQQQAGRILPKEPCSNELVREVRAGLVASPFTPNKVLSFFDSMRRR